MKAAWGFLALLVGLASYARAADGVPADGSYEGDVPPAQAEPRWIAGFPYDKKGPSLIAWSMVENGCLVQKPGAPKRLGMHIQPSPLTSKSYTVEVRFRITKCRRDGWYRSPLALVFTRKQAGFHAINVGWGLPPKWRGGYLSSGLVLKQEHHEQVKDGRLIHGRWVTVRIVVRDSGQAQTTQVFLDRKSIQQVTTIERNVRRSCFTIRSDDIGDAWEIDYVRWKNEAIGIDTPLDRALTREERKKREEDECRRKLDALLR